MKKPIKCFFGFHKWGPWEPVPMNDIGRDPCLFFWPMEQEKRECECCDMEHWRER